jgi:peptide/nickel transport system ATP-binding protein
MAAETLARLLLRLIEPDAGTILFAGEYVHMATSSRMKRLRRDMQFVFQDPYASLNPRLTIEDAVAFNLLVHGTPRSESRKRAGALLGRVGLDPGLYGRRYPHELSGGQRQRVIGAHQRLPEGAPRLARLRGLASIDYRDGEPHLHTGALRAARH